MPFHTELRQPLIGKLELDDSHPTLQALRMMLPSAHVAGGSFKGWLPDPGNLTSENRQRIFSDARGKAINQCLRNLLAIADVQCNPILRSLPGGNRSWPPGFTGSLTHKGSVVLGAMAKATENSAFGIDLERCGNRDLTEIAELIAPEGVPPMRRPELAYTFAFSAKEAAFKAQFPLTGLVLSHSEVLLKWTNISSRRFSAVAEIGHIRFAVDGVVPREPWVLSVAKAESEPLGEG